MQYQGSTNTLLGVYKVDHGTCKISTFTMVEHGIAWLRPSNKHSKPPPGICSVQTLIHAKSLVLSKWCVSLTGAPVRPSRSHSGGSGVGCSVIVLMTCGWAIAFTGHQ